MLLDIIVLGRSNSGSKICGEQPQTRLPICISKLYYAYSYVENVCRDPEHFHKIIIEKPRTFN